MTVDHGLRAESAAEAAAVARLCAERDISHTVLRWAGRTQRGNLQNEARNARRALIAVWAHEHGIKAVALGHTLDDQAETVLMRLGRGSGVDGLAAMSAFSEAGGLTWLRPMLALRRADLRTWLAEAGYSWSEDPSNADRSFARVRARQALDHLAPLGLTPERLAATAARMLLAREALDAQARALAEGCVVHGSAGDVMLDPSALAAAPRDVALRLLAAVLMWVSGSAYRPRFSRLESALDGLLSGGSGVGRTLHGCVIRRGRDGAAIRREPARVALPVPIAAGCWDGRWALVEGPRELGLLIGALGTAGLEALPRWRESARGPREALLTTPAIWHGGRLIATPFVSNGPWVFRRIGVPPPALVAPP